MREALAGPVVLAIAVLLSAGADGAMTSWKGRPPVISPQTALDSEPDRGHHGARRDAGEGPDRGHALHVVRSAAVYDAVTMIEGRYSRTIRSGSRRRRRLLGLRSRRPRTRRSRTTSRTGRVADRDLHRLPERQLAMIPAARSRPASRSERPRPLT